MVVGTHELRGTIQDLAQPFVCLQPTTVGTGGEDATSSSGYIVTGIVNRKILFNQYPKTLMR